jgi:hypothetical protein
MALETAPPIFERDGSRFLPTTATQGPWDPRSQHGGPPTMLLARELERLPAPGPMVVVRLTVELLRPIPSSRPLLAAASVLRDGRRVQLSEASLHSDGEAVARAMALRIRDRELGTGLEQSDESPPDPDGFETWSFPSGEAGYGIEAVEIRMVFGDMAAPGPAAMWVRLKRPLVAGEEPSPLVRAAAAADFGNGISSVLPWDRYLFINPDLTISLHREPVGEWVFMSSRTFIGDRGRGLSESELSDVRGRIGRSVQLLLVEPR